MIASLRGSTQHASVVALSRALGVSRSWFYAREVSVAPNAADIALRDAIEKLVVEYPGYGYRRVTAQLHRDGVRANHKRVLRIMREESLLCRLRRHFVRTTDSTHGHAVYPNLLARVAPAGIDEAWVADITYIRLPRSFCYLAAVLDAFSRRCIGWRLSLDIDTRLTLDALDMALAARDVRPGLIHHSDRGVQYASSAYVERLRSVGAHISMSGRGNPYHNAKAESFFRTLKTEEVYLNEYQDYREAMSNIGHFISRVYNHKRLHSSLGYLPPAEFEDTHCRTGSHPTNNHQTGSPL